MVDKAGVFLMKRQLQSERIEALKIASIIYK